MALWDGLDKAETFERGTFLKDGGYDLKIKRCLDKLTRKSGQALIVEFEVIQSCNPLFVPGQTVSWFQSMKDKNVAFGAVLEFLMAVYGFDAKNAAEKADFDARIKPQVQGIMNAATDEKQNYLANQTVRVEVATVKTQKGMDFSRHTWTPRKGAFPFATQAAPGAPAAPAAPIAGNGIPSLPRVG